MKVVFGCDTNAQEFKEHLMEFVKGLDHEVTDYGSDDPIYANTAIKLAKAVVERNLTEEFLYAVQVLVYQLQQIK